MSGKSVNANIRNIAIIAHVDHGKTTLVDQMFRQCGMFRPGQEMDDRLMDRMDLEKERGITIAAKNCSVTFEETRINILDTPGHADFGGEVERALSMVEGAILLVDASEGPLPQTRFVLSKAMASGLAIMVVVNKVDRADARVQDVLNEVYDLFIDLDATEEQLEFPVYYAIGREGVVFEQLGAEPQQLDVLFRAILEHVPPPNYDPGEPFQMLVSDIDYSDYLGRLAVGKVRNGVVRRNESLSCLGVDGAVNLRVSKVQVYDGPVLREVEQASAGDIVILSGAEQFRIGDTICSADRPKPLPRITVDEPTVSIAFSVNTSPLVGREGKYVQSARLRERLLKEAMKNVAIQVDETDEKDIMLVKGRGELQMAILIETLRREGFEFSVGRPRVIEKDVNGARHEPIEHVFIDVDEPFVGVITEKLSQRKGRMVNLINHGSGRVRMEFSIPSRGLIGFRGEFLTDTKGTGILNAYLEGFEPYRGDIPARHTGSLVADRTGQAVAYALFNLEPRGVMFVRPGEDVYEGMIVGEHNRDNDLDVNACKEKKLTNMRASGRDEGIVLTPVLPMTLERALEFIREDELVEVTPKSLRLRKSILSAGERQQARSKQKSMN
ncbi:MAG: translational GTPase TypA [Acidobacteria bacterium]|nr:translational GTPase TypA [Acidobacteriota bacterium]